MVELNDRIFGWEGLLIEYKGERFSDTVYSPRDHIIQANELYSSMNYNCNKIPSEQSTDWAKCLELSRTHQGNRFIFWKTNTGTLTVNAGDIVTYGNTEAEVTKSNIIVPSGLAITSATTGSRLRVLEHGDNLYVASEDMTWSEGDLVYVNNINEISFTDANAIAVYGRIRRVINNRRAIIRWNFLSHDGIANFTDNNITGVAVWAVNRHHNTATFALTTSYTSVFSYTTTSRDTGTTNYVFVILVSGQLNINTELRVVVNSVNIIDGEYIYINGKNTLRYFASATIPLDTEFDIDVQLRGASAGNINNLNIDYTLTQIAEVS